MIMRMFPIIVATALALVFQVPAQEPAPGMQQILAESLLARAEVLASDELQGRLTASPAQERVAEMIAEHFAELGLEPLGEVGEDGERGWQQRYPLFRTRLGESTSLRLGDETWTDGFGVLAATAPSDVEIEGRWVFVDPRRDIPDLGGAIPVVALPLSRIRTRSFQVLFSASLTDFVRARGMSRKLARAGAEVAVFCVLDDDSGVTNALNFVGLGPGKHALTFEGSSPADMASTWRADIPQVFLSAERSRQVLAALGYRANERGKVRKEGRAKTDDGALSVSVVREPADGINVVGLLRGSDPQLEDEALVYSAHMDHVGLRLDGDVYNGADDNGSGTAALMEIAAAFAGAEERPRRSVIFLSVSGEEQGLWGSQYYCDNPTWPLDDVVANINIDMIGRSGPESEEDEVTVTPSHGHRMFSSLARDGAALARELGLTFREGDKYYTRSDHYHFARNEVPVIFFCSGEHEDYHLVTDHADKLDPAKMERIARLAYWLGYRTADALSTPEVLGRRSSWAGTR